jgi:Tfp pilus assembly protein FimV
VARSTLVRTEVPVEGSGSSATTAAGNAAQSPLSPTPIVDSAPGNIAGRERFHVVSRGESLWSIASDLLGDKSSVARIAREVGRLWELNKQRIGTGDPDLLLVGTRLRLR